MNSTATTTASITPLGISGSITANDKTYDGTTAATIANRTLAGVLGSDSVSYSGGTAKFDDKNVGQNKLVTATGLTLSKFDSGNYTVNSTATTHASITQRPLTVTAAGVSKVYDGTTAATVTLSDDRVAGDSLTDNYTSALFATKMLEMAGNQCNRHFDRRQQQRQLHPAQYYGRNQCRYYAASSHCHGHGFR